MDLSKEQKLALDHLIAWYFDEKKSPFITLGGYAGTGKTTLIATFRQELYEISKDLKVAFCAYTGKAARVLKNALIAQKAVYKGDTVGTIHSLIYSPITNSNEEIVGWERKEKIALSLIIIDEASMIDEAIWNDLLSYKVPIIAVGDHGQLPPINGSFNLMNAPQYKLEQIHRQKQGNPIIELSIMARQTGIIPVGNYGKNVVKVARNSSEAQDIMDDILGNYNSELLVLCGYNNTRVKLNKFIRSRLEIMDEAPQKNDRVICLRNNHQKHILNGMTGTIASIHESTEKTYVAKIDFDDDDKQFQGNILAEQFNSTQPMNFTSQRSKTLRADLFDFGYAMTVHKAQGSQAKRVILFEERFKQMDDNMWKRWLYTAITRAEEELFIIGDE
jgi:exodeoxyribonuclease-5